MSATDTGTIIGAILGALVAGFVGAYVSYWNASKLERTKSEERKQLEAKRLEDIRKIELEKLNELKKNVHNLVREELASCRTLLRQIQQCEIVPNKQKEPWIWVSHDEPVGVEAAWKLPFEPPLLHYYNEISVENKATIFDGQLLRELEKMYEDLRRFFTLPEIVRRKKGYWFLKERVDRYETNLSRVIGMLEERMSALGMSQEEIKKLAEEKPPQFPPPPPPPDPNNPSVQKQTEEAEQRKESKSVKGKIIQ